MKLSKQRLMEMAGLPITEAAIAFPLKESKGYTQVTKDVWSKMSDDEQADALLSAVKDPDEAESFIGSKWEALPPQVSSNMHVYNLHMRVYRSGLKESVMPAVEADDMAVEILNHLMDNDIIERGFDEELATELIVLTLTGGPVPPSEINEVAKI